MTAYATAMISLKDGDAFGAYAAQVGATMAPFGGTVQVRGRVALALAGAPGFDAFALLAFPDADSLKAWYASDTYQALIPLRDSGADVQITLLDSV